MDEYRVKLNNPRAYIYAEYFHDQVKSIIEKEHPETDFNKMKDPPKPNP
jgi:hypothetical protein